MSNLKVDDNSYFTISKTAKIIGVQSHVLRFWEKKFLIINPKKSLSGRRYYSSKDIENLLMIKKLLYEEGFTIKGAVNFIEKKSKEKFSVNDNTVVLNLNKALNLIKQGSSIIKKNLV